MRLIYFRHAEAKKNVFRVHGGPGTELTKAGVDRAIRVGEQLKVELKNRNTVLIGGTSSHVVRTGELIASQVQCDMMFLRDLNGINLGVLHGLSEIEAAKEYPREFSMLEAWADGAVSIEALSILGFEEPMSFKRRVVTTLAKIEKQGFDQAILVGTRSNLILVQNIVKMHPCFSWDDYQVLDFGFCDVVTTDMNWESCL